MRVVNSSFCILRVRSGGSSAPKQKEQLFFVLQKIGSNSSALFSVVEKQVSSSEKNAQKKSRRFSSETLSFLFRIVVEVN